MLATLVEQITPLNVLDIQARGGPLSYIFLYKVVWKELLMIPEGWGEIGLRGGGVLEPLSRTPPSLAPVTGP